MIIFLGDRPSKKNLDPKIPFVGTKSYKTLLEWIYSMDLDISNINLENASSQKFKVYLEICSKFDGPFIEDLKIVALGNNAEKLLKKYKHPYFKLPHPSGLNRKLNDKKWLKSELKRCKKWLQDEI